MNKLILALSVTVLCLLTPTLKIAAQALYPVSFDEKVDRSTLIIEGKVKAKNSFWNPAHTMIYTANTIEVYKVFKGSLVTETIEVMTQGGSVDDYAIEVSDLLDLYKGDVGVFFCFPNQINLKNPKSKQPLWDVYSSAQGCLKYNLSNGTATAPFEKYTDIQNQFYTRIQQKTKRQPQIINKTFKPFLQQTFRVLATPSISGFSPTTVKAGSFAETSENVLTINGSNFGTATGSAGINFDNPDDGVGGTPYFVAATSDLISSWTNTQIILKVPAKVGTGTFSVVESGGASGNSPSALQVKYAIINASFVPIPTLRQFNLMNANGSGGYNILYSTSNLGGGADFSASAYKSAFENALATWQEVGGLNFSYTGTTTLQTVNAADGLNIIMLDNTNTTVAVLAAGVLAVTYSSGNSCTGSDLAKRTGFDMVIRNPGVSTGTYNFNFGPCKTSTSTTEYDLETTLLHELGHALNLGHINDAYIGSTLPNIDPGKLMHYASVNGTDRRSPDWSSLSGALYCINPRGLSYGGCASLPEMAPLTAITESKDECPVTFPSTATASNTLISFDINHATSNKTGDPQATAVNCAGTITGITNTAYYAIKTNSTGGIVTINVTGYSTTPSAQQACGGAGVELTLFQTSSCPAGQSFPSPIACRTFNTNSTLANFTGLLANTDYLLMVDGISNTKASFNLLINGGALPFKVANFTGIALSGYNTINWKVENVVAINKVVLQESIDGMNFTDLYEKNATNSNSVEDSYNDYKIIAVKYYRLKLFINNSGSIEYSNIITLKQIKTNLTVVVSPNPVKDHVNISFNNTSAGIVTFRLLDINGKMMKSENIYATTGNQNVRLPLIKGMAKGVYTLQMHNGETITSYKILVQ